MKLLKILNKNIVENELFKIKKMKNNKISNELFKKGLTKEIEYLEATDYNLQRLISTNAEIIDTIVEIIKKCISKLDKYYNIADIRYVDTISCLYEEENNISSIYIEDEYNGFFIKKVNMCLIIDSNYEINLYVNSLEDLEKLIYDYLLNK